MRTGNYSAIFSLQFHYSMYNIYIRYGCKALKVTIKKDTTADLNYLHFKCSAIGRLLSNVEE